MSALTTTQIQSAIRRKILEESTELVTDATVLLNANLAYDDIKIRSFTNDQIQKSTLSISGGVATLPANFGTLYGPGYVSATDQTPYPEKTLMELDRNPLEPGIAVDYENSQFIITPDTITSLIIRFFPQYDALSATQNPELNSYLHELIIYGAMWRIHEDLQNEELSEYYRGKYEEELEKKTGALSNYQEDNMGGNSMFNGINII